LGYSKERIQKILLFIGFYINFDDKSLIQNFAEKMNEVSSGTKISLLFDGFFFRYFYLQKSLSRIKYGTGCSVGYVRFL